VVAKGGIVLSSDSIRLRPIQERDLEALYSKLNTLEYRGPFFPLGLYSEAKLRQDFSENGFWTTDEGMLLIVTPENDLVGEIEFFPISHYLVGYELSYLLFGQEHAGKGYATDAVRLLTEYLFARLRINRVQLNIHPDNKASRRVATKAGYTREGLMRGCWFHQGRYHDLEIWSVLRDELADPHARENGMT
jgi:[ribosomal protein S5]-alanine N-acetyltransferase